MGRSGSSRIARNTISSRPWVTTTARNHHIGQVEGAMTHAARPMKAASPIRDFSSLNRTWATAADAEIVIQISRTSHSKHQLAKDWLLVGMTAATIPVMERRWQALR